MTGGVKPGAWRGRAPGRQSSPAHAADVTLDVVFNPQFSGFSYWHGDIYISFLKLSYSYRIASGANPKTTWIKIT
jgi:hypothetical protein